MLSEELGLQKRFEGREGRPCSGSARQFVPPTKVTMNTEWHIQKYMSVYKAVIKLAMIPISYIGGETENNWYKITNST